MLLNAMKKLGESRRNHPHLSRQDPYVFFFGPALGTALAGLSSRRLG